MSKKKAKNALIKFDAPSREKILSDVDVFCSANGITRTDLGRFAVNSPSFCTRLANTTQGPTIGTIERVYEYMNNNITVKGTPHELFK
ncbi:MAG: hypothetical protein E6R03_01525 [Hyphomicrobiaceae bacterium]|nr:MAG: hypothetical protein E6R03_01525 [Hyphomicrobiaceae bacterium]